MRRVDVDLAALEAGDYGRGEPLWLIGYHDGVPVAQAELPWLGEGADLPTLVGMTLGRASMWAVAERRLVAELERRLGFGPPPEPPACRISVVLSTARRGPMLAAVLAALGRLEPAPEELIVVDNGPEPGGCRAPVEAAGARYLHEPRPGLDRARTAGLAAASGDVVVFTDDDCVPPACWLAALARAFGDRAVAAVAGPVFPWQLDSAVQRRFERVASMQRGLARRVVDWRHVPPGFGYSLGVGANLAFRRRALLALDHPFPPELDAGTATESGGDAYALYRMLAAGHRVVYEPAFHTFHQHRGNREALRRAVAGYGTGIAAAATRMALVDRDVQALHALGWIVKQYWERQGLRLLGRADAADVRAGAWYLAGALRGPWRWRRARAAAHGASPPADPATSPETAPRSAEAPDGEPAISVVIPTTRPASLRSCLAALVSGTDEIAFEVTVVDDTPGGSIGALGDLGVPLQVVETGGVGAAGARNAGARSARAQLVLFVDDDVIAPPGLVAGHLGAHGSASRPCAVVGPYLPEPVLVNHVSAIVALWWEDHFRRLHDGTPTFVDVTTGNLSVPRDAFLEIGGFDTSFGSRREDWEFGLRILDAGWEVRVEHGLAATHRYEARTAAVLRWGLIEGRGDARIAARWPGAASALEPATWSGEHERALAKRLPARVARMALRLDPELGVAARVLEALERTGSALRWFSAFSHLRGAAYRRGLAQGGGIAPGAPSGARVELSLDRDDPPQTAPVIAAPSVRVHAAGVAGRPATPPDAQWHRDIVEPAAQRAPIEAWRASADEWRAPRPAEPPRRIEVRRRDEGGWRDVDAAIRDATATAVLMTLPGVVIPDTWEAEAAAVLAGERVGGMAISVVDDEDQAPTPLRFGGANLLRPLRPPWIDHVRAVGIRRDAYLDIGGLRPALAAAQADAPWVDLLERLAGAGYLVAASRLPGATGDVTVRALLGHVTALAARARTGDREAAARVGRLVAVSALSAATRLRRGGRRARLRRLGVVAAGAALGLSRAPTERA